jgi:hypothetical protein
MPLATKNGSLIVKDGLLAENCGCCGGWYCCPASSCLRDQIRSIVVTITAPDYFYVPESQSFAAGIHGSIFSGTYVVSGGIGNIFQLVNPAPDLSEITIELSPSTPCCDPVEWKLNLGWYRHVWFGSNVTTPEELWAKPGGLGYKAGVLSGTLSGCVNPVSSSASGDFLLWEGSQFFGGAPASASISIT